MEYNMQSSNQITNSNIQVRYRKDALPVTQPTVSKHTFGDLKTDK